MNDTAEINDLRPSRHYTGRGAIRVWRYHACLGTAEEPTAFLRWNKGVLEQQWEIGAPGNDETRLEWRPVPEADPATTQSDCATA
jgi:hypothetical protein